MLSTLSTFLIAAGCVTAVVDASSNTSSSTSSWKWKETQHIFSFGDSYTATNYGSIFGPDPNYSTTSGGGTWITYLTSTYNSSAISTYNFAWGGATIDTELVRQSSPSTQSLKNQTSTFLRYFAPPSNVSWNADTSLFSFFIGINDVGKSWDWTNVTLSDFYVKEVHEMFNLIASMQDVGAKNFLVVTVPPTDRTPVYVSKNATVQATYRSALDAFNTALISRTQSLASSVGDDGAVLLYDSRPIFNTLLDNADTLGFYNATGFSANYSGTPPLDGLNVQVRPYAPVGSYFWLNSFHPTWSVHNLLAHSISTFLAKV